MLSAVPRVRVVVADGHPIFRDGLRRLLETDPGLLSVSETGEGAGTVALVHELAPDILLLDLPRGRCHTNHRGCRPTARCRRPRVAPCRCIDRYCVPRSL